jgi:hypothetical protein
MKIITVIAQQVSADALNAALRGAGLLGDARAWVSAEATDLFTTSTTMLAASA